MDHPVNSLDQWLTQATAELCDDAKPRIRAEMEAQLAEAAKAQMAAGRSEAEAHQWALDSLGDPLAARHVFHRIYLWLAQATAGLCDDAQQRIHAEMEAHLAEATEVQIAAGKSEAEARQGALDSLGDPQAARRAFRRVYLTEFQAEQLELLKKKGFVGKKWYYLFSGGLILSLLLFCFLFEWNDPHFISDTWVGLLYVTSFLLFPVLSMNVTPLLFRYLSLPRAVLGSLIWYLIVSALYCADFHMFWGRSIVAIALPLYGLLASFTIALYGRIWLKIRKIPSTS